MQDKLAWFYDKGGYFSVKFGYRVDRALLTLTHEKKRGLQLGEMSRATTFNWSKFVWFLQVQNKIKIFVWHACLNIIPCARGLLSEIKEDWCQVCGKEKEMIMHVLWCCKTAKKV